MSLAQYSILLNLPAYNRSWWRVADGYNRKALKPMNPCWVLLHWNTQMQKGLVCRAGADHTGKGSYYQKKKKGKVRNSNGINGHQEHYTVLGLTRTASSREIKSAFKQLARQYHPDVNNDPDANDSFKSIRQAYEVLSNEAARNQYDKDLRMQELRINSRRRNWADSDLNGTRRHYWAEMKWQTPRVTWGEQQHETSEEPFSSFYSYSPFENEDSMEEKEERPPVEDLLRHVWFTIFCAQMLGSKVALTLFSLCAILNRQVAPGYKVAHMVAWLIGGQRGILVMVGLSFTSWFYGKAFDNLVALIALALWVGVELSRFVLIPRGAILAMTYLCYKLQLELG